MLHCKTLDLVKDAIFLFENEKKCPFSLFTTDVPDSNISGSGCLFRSQIRKKCRLVVHSYINENDFFPFAYKGVNEYNYLYYFF